ncbi:uncharacterized protein TNCV_2377751 [Trichonephila clavipes]|nr:uncharacterized protein TNCV_2377751 [Trichonephila clavipes]
MRDGIRKWEIVNPDDPDQNNGTKLLNYCIVIGPGQGLGSNTGEGMDVCKCILPSQHGGTLNSRRAAKPLVRLVEGEERWEAPDHSHGFLPLNWGWNLEKTYCHLHGAQG